MRLAINGSLSKVRFHTDHDGARRAGLRGTSGGVPVLVETSSKERTAHFMLELSARLTLVGRGTREGFACPLSQYMLADALGLISR